MKYVRTDTIHDTCTCIFNPTIDSSTSPTPHSHQLSKFTLHLDRMAKRSILNSFFYLALLFARTCCVQGVCSIHFNACQEALEAAEDHQHGYVHAFTQYNFAKFVYLTEMSQFENWHDQKKVDWVDYAKLDTDLQNVFEGAIEELGLAVCTYNLCRSLQVEHDVLSSTDGQ